jgi:CheY-like chemotaxis protein
MGVINRDRFDTPLADSSPASALTVLLVDSNAESRAACREGLTAAGLRVCEATNGRDALVQVYGVHPDAIVMDTALPFINGLELCSLLRQDPMTASLRIIVMTTDAEWMSTRRIRDAGADAVVPKRIGPEMLAAAVCAGPAVTHGTIRPPEASLDLARSKRVSKARARERYVTSRPPTNPPTLQCPLCDAPLQYDRSHIGGVNDRHPEQWDYFVCGRHGAFQYRHRTRKLRHVS